MEEQVQVLPSDMESNVKKHYMTIRGTKFFRYIKGSDWVNAVSGVTVKDDDILDVSCYSCGKAGDPGSEVDPCLGRLPGVSYACCGHGDTSKSYIVFDNGITLRGFQKRGE